MAKRGRKPKQKANGAAPPAEPVEGHNNPPIELTDDQRQALALQWKRKFEAATKTKDEAVSALRTIRKQIKAEVGDDGVALIEDMIAMSTEKGEQRIKDMIERQLCAARYMAAPLGAQFEIFADRTPAVDRARAEGKRDAMAGEGMHSSYDPSVPQYDAYVEGYQEGQKAVFNIQRKDDGALFDAGKTPEPIGDQPSSETVTA